MFTIDHFLFDEAAAVKIQIDLLLAIFLVA